jgi:hypothetical protein
MTGKGLGKPSVSLLISTMGLWIFASTGVLSRCVSGLEWSRSPAATGPLNSKEGLALVMLAAGIWALCGFVSGMRMPLAAGRSLWRVRTMPHPYQPRSGRRAFIFALVNTAMLEFIGAAFVGASLAVLVLPHLWIPEGAEVVNVGMRGVLGGLFTGIANAACVPIAYRDYLKSEK